MNSVSWVHTVAARVTAAATLRISETARGGEKEDWGKSPAPYRFVATIELVGLPKKVKCRLFFIPLLFSLDFKLYFLPDSLALLPSLSQRLRGGLRKYFFWYVCC